MQDILEHFKGYFCRAVGSAHVQSSNASWCETDLRMYMEQAAENAPLFIEAMVEACKSARGLGEDFYAPDTEAINSLLARHNIGYEVSDDRLLLREETAPETASSEIPEKRTQPKRRWPLGRALSALVYSEYDPVPEVTSRQLRVFLCHSSGDKPAVRDLYARLHEQNVIAWLDEEDLLPGQDWENEIPRAVRECDVVIVCLSRSSISKKGYVQKEIKCALDVADEQPDGTIFLIPLRLEECDVPQRLTRWQWVDYFNERGHQRLMRALEERAQGLGIKLPTEN